jgi:cytochrome P450
MTEVAPTLDLFEAVLDPEFRADPYPAYRRQLEAAPIARSEFGFSLSSYELASRALRDPRLSSSERNHSTYYRELREQNGGAPLSPFDEAPFLIFMDPPDHTRLRGLVQQAFTPKMVALIRPRAEAVTRTLLDAAIARDATIDVVRDLAYPLPMTIICELLGVPVNDQDDFAKWSSDVARGIDPPALRTPEVAAAIDAAGAALFVYVQDLIDQRRRDPRDDLLSAMIAAEAEGDRLDEIELLIMVFLLLIAGHETTMNLIGNGMLALLQNPEQLEILRNDPSLGRRAIDEMLRYDSPVQFTQRIATVDYELDGVAIDKGEHLTVILASANRDPAMFAEPDRLDVRRHNSQHHLAFGGGIHHCLGAALARVEGEIAFNALLARGSHFELAGEPLRRPSYTLRGLTSLPVTIR